MSGLAEQKGICDSGVNTRKGLRCKKHTAFKGTEGSPVGLESSTG